MTFQSCSRNVKAVLLFVCTGVEEGQLLNAGNGPHPQQPRPQTNNVNGNNANNNGGVAPQVEGRNQFDISVHSMQSNRRKLNEIV